MKRIILGSLVLIASFAATAAQDASKKEDSPNRKGEPKPPITTPTTKSREEQNTEAAIASLQARIAYREGLIRYWREKRVPETEAIIQQWENQLTNERQSLRQYQGSLRVLSMEREYRERFPEAVPPPGPLSGWEAGLKSGKRGMAKKQETRGGPVMEGISGGKTEESKARPIPTYDAPARPRAATPNADQKLDEILKRLESMEQRLERMESRLRRAKN